MVSFAPFYWQGQEGTPIKRLFSTDQTAIELVRLGPPSQKLCSPTYSSSSIFFSRSLATQKVFSATRARSFSTSSPTVATCTIPRAMILKKVRLGNRMAGNALSELRVFQTQQYHEHPFLVSFYFAGRKDNHLVLGLEFCSGGDLHGLIYSENTSEIIGSFTLFDMVLYLAEIASALQHLHKNNIYHGDIKLTNVFISSSGHLKLGDFGESKFLPPILPQDEYNSISPAQHSTRSRSRTRTQTHSNAINLAHLSPLRNESSPSQFISHSHSPPAIHQQQVPSPRSPLHSRSPLHAHTGMGNMYQNQFDEAHFNSQSPTRLRSDLADSPPASRKVRSCSDAFHDDFLQTYSKPARSRIVTCSGTLPYAAPEILFRKPHRFEPDWWSFGVMSCELLTGQTPFEPGEGNENCEVESETGALELICYYDLTKLLNAVDFPCSRAKSFVEVLLTRDMAKRMGDLYSLDCGFCPVEDIDITKHSLFECIDWDMLVNLGYQPPFVPLLPRSIRDQLFDQKPSLIKSKSFYNTKEKTRASGLRFDSSRSSVSTALRSANSSTNLETIVDVQLHEDTVLEEHVVDADGSISGGDIHSEAGEYFEGDFGSTPANSPKSAPGVEMNRDNLDNKDKSSEINVKPIVDVNVAMKHNDFSNYGPSCGVFNPAQKQQIQPTFLS